MKPKRKQPRAAVSVKRVFPEAQSALQKAARLVRRLARGPRGRR